MREKRGLGKLQGFVPHFSQVSIRVRGWRGEGGNWKLRESMCLVLSRCKDKRLVFIYWLSNLIC